MMQVRNRTRSETIERYGCTWKLDGMSLIGAAQRQLQFCSMIKADKRRSRERERL